MSKREKKIANRFEGKTIDSVECDSVNCWKFTFIDGSSETIWAEQCVNTPVGQIPGLFLNDEMDESHEK